MDTKLISPVKVDEGEYWKKCEFCGGFATKLCDGPLGESSFCGHPPISLMHEAKRADVAFRTVKMKWPITCDRMMCDRCATEIAPEVDFCPDCAERIRRKIKMQRSSGHENSRRE